MTAYPIPADAIAPCASDPDLFFGDEAGNDFTRVEKARAICRRCPYLDACRSYALGHHVEGVWAATTGKERQACQERYGIEPIPLILSVRGWQVAS